MLRAPARVVDSVVLKSANFSQRATLSESTVKLSKKISSADLKNDTQKQLFTKNPLAAARMANNFVFGISSRDSRSTNELKTAPMPLRKQQTL
jgi:hypothetical protein